MRPEHTFDAALWLWDARRHDTWTFVTVPPPITDEIRHEAGAVGPPTRFGSVRVTARIGITEWTTSVMPDKTTGCYLLPVKRAVRDANGLDTGDTATVHLRITDSP